MDTAIFQYLHNFAGQGVYLDALIIFCAKYLAYALVVLFGFIAIFSTNRRKSLIMFFYAAASVILARLVITEIIRYFYPQIRPFVALNFTPLIYDYANSFPSGHAAFFFALAMAIFFFHKKWGVVYFLGAIIITLSRIMAGIHWPIDILGGMVVGIGSAFLVNFLAKKIYRGQN